MCKIIDWLKVSNRWKHLCGGFVLGLFLTVLCALGCAGGMEYKDVAYHKNDWHYFDLIDFALTVAGGVAGQVLQLTIIWLFIHNF